MAQTIEKVLKDFGIEGEEFCRLLREHDVAVTKVVLAVNSLTPDTGITATRKLHTINRKLFRYIIGRRPTPIELDACELK